MNRLALFGCLIGKGDDQVLIEVKAAGLNPVDWKIAYYNFFGAAFPFTLGFDVSGVVRKVGKNVVEFKEGDEVFGGVPLNIPHGSLSAYAVSIPNYLVKKPAKLDFVNAGAVCIAFISAYEAFVGAKAGETVYIPGGAGGCGHYAVQIAKALGLKVITSGGRDDSIQFLEKELKADHVFNYKQKKPVEEVLRLTNGKGADLVYDSTYQNSKQLLSLPVFCCCCF
jgi:NADPH:quinone reductase-like Zn-dependent oxidoreductase